MSHDPVAPLVVVRAFDGSADPAVDWSATDAQRYRSTRDLSSLVLLGEAKPVHFHLRRMTARFVLGALESADLGEKTMLAVRAALFRVDLPNGVTLKPSKPSKLHGCDVAEDEWIDDIGRRFGIATLFEMASVAMRFASLSEDERGPFA